MTKRSQQRLEALAAEARASALEISTQALNDGAPWIAARASELAEDCTQLLAEVRALEDEVRSVPSWGDPTTVPEVHS